MTIVPRHDLASRPQRRRSPCGSGVRSSADTRDGGSVQGRQRPGAGRRDDPHRGRDRAVHRRPASNALGAQQPRAAHHRGLGPAAGPAGSLREARGQIGGGPEGNNVFGGTGCGGLDVDDAAGVPSFAPGTKGLLKTLAACPSAPRRRGMRAMSSDKEMVMSGVVSRMRRGLLWGLAAGVVLLMAGDHAQTASANNSGIDPFEILDLQIRPNAIIVLDSSGSMNETADGNATALSGRRPQLQARLGQARAEDRSSPTTRTRSASSSANTRTRLPRPPQMPILRGSVGHDRFVYTTDDATVNSWDGKRLPLATRGNSRTLRPRHGRNPAQQRRQDDGRRQDLLLPERRESSSTARTIDITGCTGGASGENQLQPAGSPIDHRGDDPGRRCLRPPCGRTRTGALVTTKRPYLDPQEERHHGEVLSVAAPSGRPAPAPAKGFKSLVPLASCTADRQHAGHEHQSLSRPRGLLQHHRRQHPGIRRSGTLGNNPTSQPAIVNAAPRRSACARRASPRSGTPSPTSRTTSGRVG